MSLLYEEKIAKRFAKIKPADFYFWTELDSVIREAFLFNKTGNSIVVDVLMAIFKNLLISDKENEEGQLSLF